MDYAQIPSPSRDLNTGPADYKSAALPAKPLGRHIPFAFHDKKSGEDGKDPGRIEKALFHQFSIKMRILPERKHFTISEHRSVHV
jgi:hypothetical protein